MYFSKFAYLCVCLLRPEYSYYQLYWLWSAKVKQSYQLTLFLTLDICRNSGTYISAFCLNYSHCLVRRAPLFILFALACNLLLLVLSLAAANPAENSCFVFTPSVYIFRVGVSPAKTKRKKSSVVLFEPFFLDTLKIFYKHNRVNGEFFLVY